MQDRKAALMKKFYDLLEKIVPILVGVFALAVALFSFYGIYTPDDGIEPYKGDFSSESFNEGWRIYLNDEPVSDFAIPGKIKDAKSGDVIRIVNTLPDNIHDGMSLMTKTSQEELYIFVDGFQRSSYTFRDSVGENKYLQSQYVVADLKESDSGKSIEIHYKVQVRGTINEITIGNGNNSWFTVIASNIHLNLFALVIVAIGAIVCIAFYLIRGKLEYNKSIFYLGVIMFEIGMWMFTESRLKQFIFSKVSTASFLAYLAVESVGAVVIMYFDEVQHRKYHKINVILESLIAGQLSLNIVLNFTGIAHFHDTLKFSHLWMCIGMAFLVINLARDVRIRAIREYAIVAAGMTLFLVLCVIELCFYYRDGSARLGVFVCIGLIMLLVATMVQVVYDVNASYMEREKRHEHMTITTLETIASSIDAKDEYTGGHSNRVGTYAAILAREVMGEYKFTEADINRIRYIGLMHDIGKIGIPDAILNKAGRLTNEEFSLMKKHVDIGYELLGAVGESMPGLLDGVKHHHERFDGRGYPDGISGERIPLIARILCIADCYDAMTSNRVYRPRLSDEQVRDEFVRCRGSQFDPKLTDTFIKLLDSGVINPDIETASKDEITQKSALFEKMVVKNITEDKEVILNPGHVRMISYVMKLMEKNGTRIDVMVAELDGDTLCTEPGQTDAMAGVLSPFLKRYDINVEYTATKHVIVLVNRSDDEMKLLLKSMNQVKGMKVASL